LGANASGASTVDDEFGPAILINKLEAPWRRNFSFGHELFHLITWQSTRHTIDADDSMQLGRLEKFANSFASTLLLPEESVTPEFKKRLRNGKSSYAEIIDLARGFEVSTEALLWRLCFLNQVDSREVRRVLSDETFREMDRQTMLEKWSTRDLSDRFVRLTFMAYLNGHISRSVLAQYLQTELADLEATLTRYGLSEDGSEDEYVRANVGRFEEEDFMAYGRDKASAEGRPDNGCTT
jgi:Zn-dependent peptidase ImmA (M78 family)